MKNKINFKHLIVTSLVLFSINYVSAQSWTSSTGRLYANPTSTRVGIGTTNPSTAYKLHVNGGSNSVHGIYSYAYGSGKRAIVGSNSHGSGHAGYFFGNVHATGNLSASINKYIRVGNTTSRVSLHAATCCPGAYIDYKGGPLQFRVEGVAWRSPLTLQADGTVVINADGIYNGNVVNTNGHKLSVNGGIWAEEVEVTVNVPSSDYVFYDDYKLMSLEDLESFVNENHHLPEVPSAEEFKKNGYKLGDMDDVLLRKVEELSLYMIDADKEIQSLKGEKELLTDQLLKLEARLTELEKK